VFVARRDRIVRIEGDRVTTVTDAISDPSVIAIHGDDLFVADDRAIWRVATRGKRTPAKLAELAGPPMFVAVDGATIYTQLFGGDDLLAIPTRGGDATVAIAHVGEVSSLVASKGVLFWTSMPDALGVAADARSVYWFDWTLGGGPMQVMRAPRPRAK
jgi:hypothetical protein